MFVGAGMWKFHKNDFFGYQIVPSGNQTEKFNGY